MWKNVSEKNFLKNVKNVKNVTVSKIFVDLAKHLKTDSDVNPKFIINKQT